MWLTLLASLLDDAVEERGRRAAAHELGRRMGLDWRPAPVFVSRIPDAPSGPIAIRLWALDRMVAGFGPEEVAASSWTASWIPVLSEDVLDSLGFRLGGVDATLLSLSLQAPEFRGLHAWADAVERERGTSILISVSPGAAFRLRSGAGPDPTPHPDDPFVAWVYDQLLVGEPGRLGFLDLDLRGEQSPSKIMRRILRDSGLSLHGSSLRDWWTQSHPDLRRFTLSTALAESARWHAAQADAVAAVSTIRRGSALPATAQVVVRWPDGWSLQRLWTRTDYAREGAAMDHCVGGNMNADGPADGDSRYWRAERDGLGMTLSLRDPNGVPKATIQGTFAELEGWNHTVTQIQGPNDNAIPTDALPYLLAGLHRVGVPIRVPEGAGLTDILAVLSNQARFRLGLNRSPGVRTEGQWAALEKVRRPIEEGRAWIEAHPVNPDGTMRVSTKMAYGDIAVSLGRLFTGIAGDENASEAFVICTLLEAQVRQAFELRAADIVRALNGPISTFPRFAIRDVWKKSARALQSYLEGRERVLRGVAYLILDDALILRWPGGLEVRIGVRERVPMGEPGRLLEASDLEFSVRGRGPTDKLGFSGPTHSDGTPSVKRFWLTMEAPGPEGYDLWVVSGTFPEVQARVEPTNPNVFLRGGDLREIVSAMFDLTWVRELPMEAVLWPDRPGFGAKEVWLPRADLLARMQSP